MFCFDCRAIVFVSSFVVFFCLFLFDVLCIFVLFFFFFQAEDGIGVAQESRGLGVVYKSKRPSIPWATDRKHNLPEVVAAILALDNQGRPAEWAGPYKTLTAPTNYSGEVLGVAGTIKKKKTQPNTLHNHNKNKQSTENTLAQQQTHTP